MLINNGVRFGGGPMRTMGAALAGVTESGRWGESGSLRNIYAGQATVISGASIANKSAYPGGYVVPYCWVLAQKPGGLASRGRIAGTGGTGTGNLAGGLNGVAPLAGAGDITSAAGTMLIAAAAALSGDGSALADITGKLDATAALLGTGDISSANLAALSFLVAALTGDGDITDAELALIVAASADLAGSGTITNAAGVLGAVLAAALAGDGALSAGITGKLEAVAALAGAGDLVGAITALGHLTSGLTGAGSFTGASQADGFMYADIIVAGELLTTGNVAAAVWQAVAEGTFTYDQLVRIVASASAGKSSGGPGSPVFRNLSDTQDQLSGTADSSGNRSAATYGS